jgi:hypothetical protein
MNLNKQKPFRFRFKFLNGPEIENASVSDAQSTHKRKENFSGHSGRNTANLCHGHIAVSSGHAYVNTLRAYAEPTIVTKTSISLVSWLLRELLIQGKDDESEDESEEATDAAQHPTKHRKLTQGQNVFNFYFQNK